jgi:hypothetical protein
MLDVVNVILADDDLLADVDAAIDVHHRPDFARLALDASPKIWSHTPGSGWFGSR